MRLTASAEIDAPAEAVWACLDEPEKILQWVEGAVSHEYVTTRDPAGAAGQKFRQRLKQGPEIREFEGTLIAFEPHTHYAFTIPSPSYDSEAHFRLTALGPARTRVDYAIDVTLKTLKAKIGAALLRVPLAFFVPKQMKRLKALAERGRAAKEDR